MKINERDFHVIDQVASLQHFHSDDSKIAFIKLCRFCDDMFSKRVDLFVSTNISIANFMHF